MGNKSRYNFGGHSFEDHYGSLRIKPILPHRGIGEERGGITFISNFKN